MRAEYNGLVVSEPPTIVIRNNQGALRAYASVTLNGAFKITDIRIIQTDQGRVIVAMPSIVRPDGRYQDLAHPIDEGCRRWFDEVVLTAYVGEARRWAEWTAAQDFRIKEAS